MSGREPALCPGHGGTAVAVSSPHRFEVRIYSQALTFLEVMLEQHSAVIQHFPGCCGKTVFQISTSLPYANVLVIV